MKIDWSPLQAELNLWRQNGLSLPLWWRDDDAVADTPALSQLLRLSEDLALPVHVAVIPDLVEPTLPPALSNAIPLIHGWRHISHSPQGVKNAEFGQPRAKAAQELQAAMTAMRSHFKETLLPIFVPPWNRIDQSLLQSLSAAGYAGLSTYGPRKSQIVAPGLVQINTHIDPIFWRGHRGLADPATLVMEIVQSLHNRRIGQTDAAEPLGYLTHHLVHTDEVWSFSADLLRVLLDGGAEPADLALHLKA